VAFYDIETDGSGLFFEAVIPHGTTEMDLGDRLANIYVTY